MIGVADRRDEWVGPSSRPERLRASLRLEKANPQRERNGALHGVHAAVRFKKNLTPPTLSEKTRFLASQLISSLPQMKTAPGAAHNITRQYLQMSIRHLNVVRSHINRADQYVR